MGCGHATEDGTKGAGVWGSGLTVQCGLFHTLRLSHDASCLGAEGEGTDETKPETTISKCRKQKRPQIAFLAFPHSC